MGNILRRVEINCHFDFMACNQVTTVMQPAAARSAVCDVSPTYPIKEWQNAHINLQMKIISMRCQLWVRVRFRGTLGKTELFFLFGPSIAWHGQEISVRPNPGNLGNRPRKDDPAHPPTLLSAMYRRKAKKLTPFAQWEMCVSCSMRPPTPCSGKYLQTDYHYNHYDSGGYEKRTGSGGICSHRAAYLPWRRFFLLCVTPSRYQYTSPRHDRDLSETPRDSTAVFSSSMAVGRVAHCRFRYMNKIFSWVLYRPLS